MKERTSIIRLSNQRGGLNPEAVETLALEFASPLYFLEHQLRHPFGIYNVSLDRVFSSLRTLMTEHALARQQDIRSNKSDPKWDEHLLHNLEKLLYALMEHMDDCENIIKCFFPHGTKLNREANVRVYQSAVGSYRNHIGKVVNHLKHSQGRLRSFAMYIGDTPHLGYFVEGLSEDGSLGPAPNIHSHGSTAFSYARDIRFHVYNLYDVSLRLSEAVNEIAVPNQDKQAYLISDKNTEIEKVIMDVAKLPLVVFPDELQKEFPHIALENNRGIIKFTATMKKRPHGLRTGPSPAVFVTFYQTDGVSRSFRMPYHG